MTKQQESLVDPPRRKRLFISSDAKNEADDQFAIAHALLSPSLDVCGISAAHFGVRGGPRGMELSRDEIEHVARLCGRADVPVYSGASQQLSSPTSPTDTPAARAIIEESRQGPLFVAALGPLTDVASALLLDGELSRREVTVVWVGGPPYPPLLPTYAPEFNLSNDVIAANVVFASGVEVWQIPMSAYNMVGIGISELAERVGTVGDLGRYLADEAVRVNRELEVVALESRALADSTAISVVLNRYCAQWQAQVGVQFAPDGAVVMNDELAARQIGGGKIIRVCDLVDSRWLVEDLYFKLKMRAESAEEERRTNAKT